MSERAKDRIIIVGAGMAGLTAGLHLAERGMRPLILEADPHYCGGRVAGGDVIELNGWRFREDHGVHGIWSPYRNLQAMLVRHALRPLFVPAREEYWLYKRNGRVKGAAVGSAIRHSWIPAPFHYLNLFFHPRFLRMLGPRDCLSLFLVWYGLIFAVGIDPLAEGQPMEGMWLSDLMKGWSPALRALFLGLARNGLSAQPEEIPLSGFIAFLRFYTLLRRDAWAFSYLPADGGSCLVEPLVDKICELGGKVEMGFRVESLGYISDEWRVDWNHSSSGRKGSFQARQLILATDAPNTAQILGAGPDTAEAAADLYWPRGMATAVIRLWYDRTPTLGGEGGIFSGDFVLDNYFWLHRIQDQYRRWHKATGGSAIEVHIYGPPSLLEEPDTVLLARAIADVQSAVPELRGHLIHQTLRRNKATHTLFGLGPAERHLGIETPWPHLFCCGDWVRHPSPSFFLERSCVTGILAANAVLCSNGRPEWPLLDPPRPEPLAALIERLMRGGRRLLRRRA